MSKTKQVTIVDVAEFAGVSIATVSNVLNRGGIRTSRETIRKVELAADELGYRRNIMAAGLSRKKTFEIGLIIPGFKSIYGMLAEHLQLEAHHAGYHLTVFSSNGLNPDIERRHLEVLLQRRVDGLICHGLAMGMEATRSIVNQGTPLVLINGWSWPEDISIGSVNLGIAGACEQSCKVLTDRGCTMLCYVGHKGSKIIDERRRLGFGDGIDKYGSGLLHESTDIQELDYERYLTDLVQRHSGRIGIIAFDDNIALKLLSAANKLHIPIPERLMLIGVNNDYIAINSYPGISSWEIPYMDQAQSVIHKLINKLEGRSKEDEVREMEVPLTFVERETTKIPEGL
ncbi:LacI family DNA-binding transcriptional regulator [Paenibacillus sp. NPDC056579]|uniref:LacI family DNA-binding transcriptional regulator n=1 Tax=Paenibacillus sp. NPDC056579 TaxID=3345871 RepID=UPI0036C6D8E7